MIFKLNAVLIIVGKNLTSFVVEIRNVLHSCIVHELFICVCMRLIWIDSDSTEDRVYRFLIWFWK